MQATMTNDLTEEIRSAWDEIIREEGIYTDQGALALLE